MSDPIDETPSRSARAKGAPTPRSKGGVLVLTKAREVLDCFTPDTPRLRIVEIQAMTGFPTTTVARLVQTLQNESLLDRNGDYYRISSRVLTWAAAATSGSNLVLEAALVCHDLCEETAETTGVYVRSGSNRLTIALEVPNREIVHRGSVGQLHALAIGAPGWVIMAHDSGGKLLALEDATSGSVLKSGSRRDLDDRLTQIRSDGYAVTNEERQRGLTSIAAPVFETGGAFVGTIGIAGPTWRVTTETVEALVPQVCAAAAALSARLGYLDASTGRARIEESAGAEE